MVQHEVSISIIIHIERSMTVHYQNSILSFCVKSDTWKWGISMFQRYVGFHQLGQHQK